MNIDFPTPALEKRLLPLLDVTLVLVGVLILLVGQATPTPPDVWTVQVHYNGDVTFENVLLADRHAAHSDAIERFIQHASESGGSQVNLCIPPQDPASEINQATVWEVQREIQRLGLTVSLQFNCQNP